MKNIIRSIVVFTFLLTSPILLNTTFADTPPDPGSGPGSGDPPVGGGSPIGGGLIIMLSMGAIYGGKKIYDAREKIIG